MSLFLYYRSLTIGSRSPLKILCKNGFSILPNTKNSPSLYVLNSPQYKEFLFFVCWGIWRARNLRIFKDVETFIRVICLKILKLYEDYYKSQQVKKHVVGRDLVFPNKGVVGFFDGASISIKGGWSMVN